MTDESSSRRVKKLEQVHSHSRPVEKSLSRARRPSGEHNVTQTQRLHKAFVNRIDIFQPKIKNDHVYFKATSEEEAELTQKG